MKSNLKNEIISLFKHELKINILSSDTNFTKNKNYDSFKHLEMIMLLERKYNIKFSINENFNIKTIDQFEKLINEKLSKFIY